MDANERLTECEGIVKKKLRKSIPKKLPKLAVFKFASCDGCQLSLLNCEEELLSLTENIQIANFYEASRNVLPPPYDLSLVEGSVTTEHDRNRILELRKQSKFLVTIGACATAGGIQALRNFKDVKEFTRAVYAHPEYISTLDKALPISAFVKVDYELRGCPINKKQLLEVVGAFLNGRRPVIADESVCLECKRKGNVCVMVAQGSPCLGPVTHAGCDALCPTYTRACFACYGPKENANTQSMAQACKDMGLSSEDLVRTFRSYNSASEVFVKESCKHE